VHVDLLHIPFPELPKTNPTVLDPEI